ncbi:TRAP transporter small permease [Allofranklinella schreckenbergeri]|nr:TRAP transporter small permease [Allofranklinella schreckenbergeri]
MAMQMPAPQAHNPPEPAVRGWYGRLMQACGALAALLFGAMGVLIASDVVLRNLGLHWIVASTEISEYMLMVATFIAAPWLLYHNGHIRIDLLVQKLPLRWALRLELLCDALAFAVCAVLAWQSVRVARDAAQQGAMVFKEWMFPEWWLSVPLLLGAVLLAMEFARRALRAWRMLVRTGG